MRLLVLIVDPNVQAFGNRIETFEFSAQSVVGIRVFGGIALFDKSRMTGHLELADHLATRTFAQPQSRASRNDVIPVRLVTGLRRRQSAVIAVVVNDDCRQPEALFHLAATTVNLIQSGGNGFPVEANNRSAVSGLVGALDRRLPPNI